MTEPATDRARPTFVVCLDDGGHTLSLERRKVYRTVTDTLAESHGMLRVIDETGEDYLFPASLFVALTLSEQGIAALVELTPEPATARSR